MMKSSENGQKTSQCLLDRYCKRTEQPDSTDRIKTFKQII